VAWDVLKLTHALVRYGTISHPVKRRVRDVVIPALGRSTMIQRRAVGRLSHVRVAYPPGPLARQDRGRGAPKPGQRMPDIEVGAGGQATTLHTVLRGGRHVLVVPAPHAASVRSESGLRPHLTDLDIVTAEAHHGPGLVLLVRPDGHVAARGRPGSLQAVTGYLRDLFTEPASYRLRLDSGLLKDDVLAAADPGGAGADEAGLLGDAQPDGVPVRDGGPQPAVERDGPGVGDGGTAELGAPALAGQVGADTDGDVQDGRVAGLPWRTGRLAQAAEAEQAVLAVGHGPVALVRGERLQGVIDLPGRRLRRGGQRQAVLDGQLPDVERRDRLGASSAGGSHVRSLLVEVEDDAIGGRV
jgi:hypothetical protein